MDLDLVMRSVQAVLERTPELRRSRVPSGLHPLTGHCYVGAEALYHLGARKAGFTPRVARGPDGETHWWLEHRDGRVMDPTAAQYHSRGLVPPYLRGRRCGFLTLWPSQRAGFVIRKVLVGAKDALWVAQVRAEIEQVKATIVRSGRKSA